jgi:ATP/ADP translocase
MAKPYVSKILIQYHGNITPKSGNIPLHLQNSTKYTSFMNKFEYIHLGFAGMCSIIIATNYEKFFGLTQMKVGGSWIAMLIASLVSLVTGAVIVITLLYEKIIEKRSQSSKEIESTYSSRVNSRKASKVSANLSTNDYHPFGSLQQFQECGLDKITGLDAIERESDTYVNDVDNEYTIPEVDDDHSMQSYDDIVENHNTEEFKSIEDNGDLTIGKLSDFSSQPLPDMIDAELDTSLNHQNRSISFENMLYADRNK